MVDFVKQDFAEMAQDVRILTGLEEEDEGVTQQHEQQLQQQQACASGHREFEASTAEEREEAEELLTEFCERYSESRFLPDQGQLDALWSRVSVLYGCVLHPGPIVHAMMMQLRWPKGEQHWQPRLRALCALEFFHNKGAVGSEIFNAVGRRGVEVIRRLIAVPECQEKAMSIITLFGKDGFADDGDSGQEALPVSSSMPVQRVELDGEAAVGMADLLDLPLAGQPTAASSTPAIKPIPPPPGASPSSSGELPDLL